METDPIPLTQILARTTSLSSSPSHTNIRKEPELVRHETQAGNEELAQVPQADSSLPPKDGGRQAWAYLISATVLETLVWGLPLSYGVFLRNYLEIWPESTTLLPQGIMYLLLPPIALYLSSRPEYKPVSMWLGLVLIAAGLIGAGFASAAWGVVLGQGAGYALGGVLLYCPVTAYMFEWWETRIGLASGIIFSGTGLGGLTIPFIAQSLLNTYGRKPTLIAFGIAYTILLSLTIPWIKPRIPVHASSHKVSDPVQGGADGRRERARLDWTFLKGRAFWALFIGIGCQGFGGFVPGTYLPSYADKIHLSSTAGTLSVALMNAARIPGQIIIGHLSDRYPIRPLILLMAGLSAGSVLVVWGGWRGEGGVILFSLLFGGFAGSYTALFPTFISVVSAGDPNLRPILYALFSFARGLGNILSGPVSTRLLATNSTLGKAKGGYGVEGYGGLIVFTGGMLLASGVGAGFKKLKRD